jgi:TolB-like protein/Flp pilus assembly protein TadD
MTFISEIKRRNVFRVAVAYVVVAWALIEVTDTVFPRLALPEWLVTAVIVLLILGFPVAMVLAWAYQLMPDGPAPAAGASAQPAATSSARGTNWLIAAGLLAVVAILIFERVWDARSPDARPGGISTIAVLPFANLSGDPEQEYFADGMTEALIGDLSQVRALAVISRTSVMRYKNSQVSIPEIASALGADALVEGTVLRSGDKIRITARLIQAHPERPLWSAHYDRELRDVLIVHSQLAETIARKVQLAAKPEDEPRLSDAPAVLPKAYEAYLRGRFHWNKRTGEQLQKAIALFNLAIEVDPAFARAHAGLADTYVIAPIFGLMPPRQALAETRAAATAALAIDEASSEAHAALAYALALYEWDWEGAEREFTRALELNPSAAMSRFHYAATLAATGRFDEAIAEAERARTLDPVSPIVTAGLAWVFHLARRYDEAIEESLRVLELDPDFPIGHFRLGAAYLCKGLYAEAVVALQKAIDTSGGDPTFMAYAGHAHAAAGDRAAAEEILRQVEAMSGQRYVPATARAIIYTGLGESDAALDWLDMALEERSWDAAFLQVEPVFDPLRQQPGFQRLVRRLKVATPKAG